MHALSLSPDSAPRTPPALLSQASAAPGEYLTFRLGESHYAIDILAVQEIRSFEEPTRLANAPPDVRGVMDLRGVIVPVLDLRLRLGLPRTGDGADAVVIVVALAGQVAGLIVDAVSDVAELGDADFRPAPDFAAAGSTGLVQCIALRHEREATHLVVVLQAAKLFEGWLLGRVAHAPVPHPLALGGEPGGSHESHESPEIAEIPGTKGP